MFRKTNIWAHPLRGQAVRSSLFVRPCGLSPKAPLLPSFAQGLLSRLLLLLALMFFLGQASSIQAQTFPVTSLVQVSNFSPQLEAYDDPGRVVVTLISTDERPEYEVLLRFTLSGPGFSIRTREEFLPFPVTLQRNVPLILTGAQLRDYFDPANLSFGGQSLENILAGGGLLTEGPVSLCVEAFDYNRFFDPPVSNTGCATGIMRLQRPPVLTEPGSEVIQSFPQQLRFQWQPQHAGFIARYTLEVYEDILPGMGDNLIIENTQPLLVKSSTVPFYLMTSFDPLLQVGSRYLVRVHAEDIAGQAIFLNNGWSDIYSFVYLGDEDPPFDCPAPSGFTGTALDPFSLQLNWQNDPLVASWLIVNAQNDSIALPAASLQQQFTNLTPEQEYSYQLCAICDDGSSNCQSIAVLLPADTTSGACGPALLAQSLPLDDASLLISWNDIPQATGFTLRWSAQNTISPGTTTTSPSAPASPNRGRRQTPSQSPGPPPASSRVPQQSAVSLPAFVFVDSLNLPAGSIDAQIDELVIGTTYQFELCKICPDGSLVCTSWTETFNGLDDDCITSLDILRTDSTATSLSLSWTFDPQNISADSAFTLIWQVSDHSLPADSAVLYYAAGSFTIDSLEAFRAYDLRICAECTAGQPACRELEPFGGCPAAYDPYLADIDLNNALIAWQPEPGDSLRLTNARLKPRVAIRWDSLTVGDPTYFHLNPLGLDSAQIAEALALNAGVTYIAQIQTQCTDSLWSDWSTPVLFNLNCAVADSLWLIGVSDSSALIAGLAHSNAIHYAFEYRRTDQQSWTVANNLSSPLLDLQALRADTEYEVRMRYWCSQGVWSDYTLSFFFNTLPPCLPPARITVDPIFTDAAQLNWDTYQDAVQTEIRYRPRASGYFYFSYYPSPWQSAITPDSFQLLSTLQEGAAYDFQMRSDCAVNFSEWTALDQFNLLCSPPSSITVTDTTYESATVQLNGLPNGAQSTSLEYRELGDSIWLTASTTFTYASLQNLDDLTYYELRATATCASGETSPYSDTTQFRTPVKCLIPENLVASNLQPFSAQVDWDVTGTINEWEVLLYSPTQITPVSAPAGQQFTPGPASPSGGTVTPPPPGNTNTPAGNRRINQGRNNANSGATGSTPAANPGIGSVGTNPARATNITQNQPVPYAGWQRFTVTNPTKLFEQLAQNTEYKVVVRARCPEFGWTDYSDTLTFRTLTDCRKPYNLAVSEVYQTSVRTQWGTFNNYAVEYQAILESVQPIAIGGLIQTAPAQPIGPGNISNPGGGGTTPARGNNMNTARVGNVSPNPTMNSSISQAQASLGIYKDSLITPDRFAIFTGLQPNTEYRFRVRSRCDNFGWTDHSDWFLFRTDECAIPLDIVEEALDRSTMRISWTPSYGINDYELKYKLADDPGADWITHNTQDSLIDLTNLLSNQIYDYILTEKCQGGTGTNSAPQDSFLMERPSINNGLYVCGLETQVDLSNQVPLASLLPGDTIIAFDFPIVITMATGSAGYFSGMGDIRMPYFNKAKFSFEFDNIFVNDEYRMVGGYLEATGFGIEVLPPWADSLLSDILEVLELADSVLQQEQIGLLEDLMALGDNANLPPDLQQAIQDVLNCFQQASTQAQIDSCNVMMDSVLILVNDFLDELYEGDFQVVFKKDQNQQFGFDAKGTLEPESWYEKRTIASADYFLAYKSVKEGNPEMVDGVVMPPGVIDSVAFSQPSGTPLPVSITVDTAAITFVGQSGDDYFLVAEQVTNDSTPNHIAGLLSVVPYPELPLKVVLVPLSATAANGVSAGTIQNDVRAILGQAVVNPTITLASAFSAPGYDGTLDAVGSGIFTNYSPEMNDIIDGYENGPGVDGDTYYLFLVDSFEVTSRAGFMPRGRQFGFIYMGNAGTGSALSRTIAHEIAHGAYVLEHTFAAHPGDLPQGSTNNLMDYNGGSHLYKWQWDLIHDPVNAPILPGDSGSSSVNFALFDNFDGAGFTLENEPSINYCYYTPGGALISFNDPSKLSNEQFSYGPVFPSGCLYGFNYDGIEYTGLYKKGNTVTPAAQDSFYFYYSKPQFTAIKGSQEGSTVTLSDLEAFPAAFLQPSAFQIMTTSCPVLVRKYNEDCLEEFFSWSATSSAAYKEVIASEIIIPSTATKVPSTDPIYALLQEGPGKEVYDYAIATGYETTQENCGYLRSIAQEMNALGEILLDDYAQQAWSKQTEFHKYFYENYNDWGYDLKSYLRELRRYRTRLDGIKEELSGVDDQDRAVFLTALMNDNQLKVIPLSLRIEALQVLTSESMTGDIFGFFNTQNAEIASVRLVRTVPQNQTDARNFLDTLKSTGLLRILDGKYNDIGWPYDDGNYFKFASAIMDLIKIAYPITEDEAFLNNLVGENKVYHWGDKDFSCNGGTVSCSIDYDSDWVGNELELSFTSPDAHFEWHGNSGSCTCTSGIPEVINANPFSWVIIYASKDESFGDTVFLKKGQMKAVPAFMLNFLANEDANQTTRLIIGTGVDVLFLAIGVGQLSAASKVLRAIALMDVIVQSGDIVFNLAEETIVNNYGQAGKDFMMAYRRVSLVLGLVTLGSSLSSRKLQRIFDDDAHTLVEFVEDNATALRQSNQLGETTTSQLEAYATDVKRLLNIAENALGAVVDKIARGRLAAALDEAVAMDPSPVLTSLKNQFATLEQQYRNNVLLYEDFDVARNLIRQQLIAELPLTISGQSGLSNPIVQNIINNIANGKVGQAVDDAYVAIDDLAVYRQILALKGRNSTLLRDENLGILNFGQINTTRNQIVDGLLNTLPNTNVGPGALTNVELNVLVQRLHLGEVDDAFSKASIFSTSPSFSQLNDNARILMDNYITGAIDYAGLTVSRNQIFKQLIDELPLNIVGTGGLTEVALEGIRGKIANNSIISALDDALAANIDPDYAKTLFQIKGRYKNLKNDILRGTVDETNRILVENQILEALVISLPKSFGGIPAPINVPKIIDAIKNDDIKAALEAAEQLGGNANISQLRTQFDALVESKIQGIINYEQLNTTRNQIRSNLISELSPAATGTGGLSPPVVTQIQNHIAADRINEAFTDVFTFNMDDVSNQIFVALQGRYKTLLYESNMGVSGFGNLNDEIEEILTIFVNTLP